MEAPSAKQEVGSESPDHVQVSLAPALSPSIISDIQTDVFCFQSGRIKHFSDSRKSLTSDPDILQTVNRLKLEFNGLVPGQPSPSSEQTKLNSTEREVIGLEIQKLADKGVISLCTQEPGQFVSLVFTHPKKDGNHRMILDLKKLNKSILYRPFKMDTLQSALQLVTQGCNMASIDLKDVFFSIPIFPEHKKIPRFVWKKQLWQFDAMPNGLELAARKFTKVMKPVFATLRRKGHISTAFIDDSLLVAKSKSILNLHVAYTIWEWSLTQFI